MRKSPFHLISQNIPDKYRALTSTQDEARQLKKPLDMLLGKSLQTMTISTLLLITTPEARRDPRREGKRVVNLLYERAVAKKKGQDFINAFPRYLQVNRLAVDSQDNVKPALFWAYASEAFDELVVRDSKNN